MTEDEMVGWHHRLNGLGFGQTPGVGDGQGGLTFMGLQRVRHDRATELNPLLSLFISLINYPRFGQWELFPLESYVLLTSFHLSLRTFLLLGTMTYSRLILYISCPDPGIHHFSMEPWFLSGDKSIQKPRSEHMCSYAFRATLLPDPINPFLKTSWKRRDHSSCLG